MQVFNTFLKSAIKFLPQTVLYFIIFTSISIVMSFSAADSPNTEFRSVELDVGIIDQDESTASYGLKNYLGSMHHLMPIKYDKNTLLDRLFYRDLDYILVIPEGFEKRLLNGEENSLFETIQIPGVYSSMFIDDQINTCLKTIRLYLAGGYDLNDALSNAEKTLQDASNQVSLLTFEEETSPAMTGIYYFFQFLPYVLLSMILCGLTPILNIFWEKNLSRRISCSSTSLISQNLQLALGSILYCLGIWGLFILTARIVYGSSLFTETGGLCIINSFLVMPLGIAISLIISSFSPTSNIINMLNNIISLGMSFLCGIFVPQKLLGDSILSVSRFLPLYWYIKNNNMVFGFSEETFLPETFWKYAGIQLLFIIALFSVALVVSKLKRGVTVHSMAGHLQKSN